MRQFNSFRWILPALGSGLGLAATAQAQTTLYTFNGTAQYDRLGAAVAGAGDVNNDGFPDIIVGATEDFQIFFADKGFARIYSGATGAILYTLHGDAQYDQFGFAVDGIGDVNNDGFDDVAIGAPSVSITNSLEGLVRVISGATGGTLFSRFGPSGGWALGSSVSGAGDTNADGRPDWIAGAPDANVNGDGSGTARLYSGLDGTILREFPGSAANKRRGYSVSELDDVNSDGKDDVIVGSLFDGVKVYSGANGSAIHTFTGPSIDVYGKAVCSVGDLNNDGVRDIVIGATQEDVFTPGTGYIQVRSGVSGSLLFSSSGVAVGDRFGHKVADAGDFNSDGTPDVIVGADPSNGTDPSYARVISGVNGSILTTIFGDNSDDDFGFSVGGLGDVNGNGKNDVVIGAPHGDPAGLASGYARVYEGSTGQCGGTSNYCVTSPNSVGPGALISSSGSTSIAANNFVLLATGCPPGQFGVFYYGPNQIQFPFGDGFRCVGAGSGSVWRLPIITTSPQGLASFQINYNTLPNGGEIVPFSVWNFQFWYRDPGFGQFFFNLSNALNAQFCP